jgi:hypothetical protein
MFGRVGRLIEASGNNPLVTDKDGHQVVTAAGAKYADLVDSGRVFSVANQAVVSTTAGLATTWTGLAVCNPAASMVDLVMLKFGVAQGAAGAAGTIGLMIADVTGIAAALTIKNAKIGNATGTQALADDGATCGTPILHRVFGSIGSLATTGYGLAQGLVFDLDGGLILPPGYTVLTYTSAATTSALMFHFLWAEITR